MNNRLVDQDIFKRLASTLDILDIGARGGLQPEFENLQNISVTAFEPDPQECNKLNLESDSRISYLPKALAGADGERTLYLTKNAACSSLYKPNKELLDHFEIGPFFDIAKEIQVECQTIASIDSNFDFVKIDVQGAELEILKSGKEKLAKVLGVWVEMEYQSMYIDQPLYFELDLFLRECGLVPFDLELGRARRNISSDVSSKSQILWAHVLYLRDFTKGHLPPIGELLKIIALAEIYGLNDYALDLLNLGFEAKLFSDSDYKELVKHFTDNYSVKKPVPESDFLRGQFRLINNYVRDRFPMVQKIVKAIVGKVS